MAKKKLEDALKDARNTTVLIEDFIKFVKTHQADETFTDFKKLYANRPFYNDIKDPILSEVEALGMDVDHINELL